MKKIFLLIFILQILVLFVPSISTNAKQITKDGSYYVYGYNINSIKETGNKITITTYTKKQMEYYDEMSGMSNYINQKSFTFKKDDDFIQTVRHYWSENHEKATVKKIKKYINTSMENEDDYEYDDSFDKPMLLIGVENKKAVVAIYYEGALDALE